MEVTASDDDASNEEGDPCDAYVDDFGQDNPVIVYDGAGKKIAVGTLERGTSSSANGDAPFDQCTEPFTIESVPLGQTVYDLQVGGRCYEKVTASPKQVMSEIALTYLGENVPDC